jgi:hypothetical protein
MLHATGGSGLATEALLRSLIANESLAQHFQSNRAIDQEVSRTIYRTHAAAAQRFIEAVLSVEYPSQERIKRHICDRCVSLQRRVVTRTQNHVIRELPTASGALKHSGFDVVSRGRVFIITQKLYAR